MRVKVDPLEYDFTEEHVLQTRPDMLDWLKENDPGRAYVIEVLTGKLETPKKLPPRNQLGTPEFPPGIWMPDPKANTLDMFTHPYGCDLKEYVFHQIARMGPCHNDDVIAACMGLCSIVEIHGEEVIQSPEMFEIIDILHQLLGEGRIYCPDEDVMVDLIPGPRLDMEPVRVVELFAGIGAFRKALSRIGVPHTAIISEINPFATMAYQAIHGEVKNLGDISKVEHLPGCDLLTYGFPCQDISIAGKQAGLKEDSGTRSSLLWEVRRLLDDAETLPRILVMENVKNLVSKKHMPDFQRWIDWLASKGYVSTWAETDPTWFGVPQHRPRIIMVSILGGPGFDWSGMPTARKEDCHLKNVISNVCERPDDGTNSEGIRRLTPAECYRLMGFDYRDAWRASRVCSGTQMYQQAGNSIVVDVLEWIFREFIRQGIWEVRD